MPINAAPRSTPRKPKAIEKAKIIRIISTGKFRQYVR
jgi:hypothetical protein